ncbi:MAG: polysaccharide biosynthesis C-terminal domain-containing protein [Coriobacteriia bacterium]|nr:polysaccharide biosynthesis C-terminal domain-containing protein [Coriobacteriia bacterium]
MAETTHKETPGSVAGPAEVQPELPAPPEGQLEGKPGEGASPEGQPEPPAPQAWEPGSLSRILQGAGTDTLKYFPVRLVPALTAFITVPVFSRMVSQEQYGNFSIISSATSLLAMIATNWVANSIVRYYWVYEKEGRNDEYVATSVWATVASIVAACLVAGAGVWLLRNQLPRGILALVPIGLASLAVNYLCISVQQILRAGNKATRYAVLSVASAILAAAFSVFFVAVVKLGAYGILLGVVIGNAVVMPLGLWMARKEGRLAPSLVRRDIMSEFASYGLPLVPAAVSGWALVLADRYIIQATRSAAEVGLYSVSYNLGDKIMNLIVTPIMITMGPVMIQTFEKKSQSLAEKVQGQFTRYYAMVTFPMIAGAMAIAHEFFQVFVGPDFRSGYRVLPIIMIGVMFYGLTQIAANGLALYKKSKIMMTNTLISAAFNIVSNFILVPRMGYMAAAYNTVTAYVVLLILTYVRSEQYMAWQVPWKDIAKITLASTIMGLTVWGVFHSQQPSPLLLVAEVLTGFAAYPVALLLLKAVRPDEKEFIIGLLGKVWRKLGLKRG